MPGQAAVTGHRRMHCRWSVDAGGSRPVPNGDLFKGAGIAALIRTPISWSWTGKGCWLFQGPIRWSMP